MKRSAIAITLLLIGFTPSTHGTMPVPEQYSTPGIYGHMLIFSQRTGTELHAVDIDTGEDVWVWSSDERSVRTRPTIVDGVAYIWVGNTREDSRACAIDCRSGKSLWETPDGGWTFESAVVAGDVVLFAIAADEDEIHAFDRKTGKRLWLRTGCDMLLVHGGTILATTAEDRQLALLDSRTGETTFETPLAGETFTGPKAACSAVGEAVVGCTGVLLKLSIPNRAVLWRKSTPRQRWMPTICDGNLYLLSKQDYPYPYAPGKRQQLQLRSLADGSITRSVSLEVGTLRAFPVLVFDGVIVIASGGRLLGLNRQTLREKWRLDTGGVYQVSRDGKCVYVGGTGPCLWRIDAATGTRTWTYDSRSRGAGSTRHPRAVP